MVYGIWGLSGTAMYLSRNTLAWLSLAHMAWLPLTSSLEFFYLAPPPKKKIKAFSPHNLSILCHMQTVRLCFSCIRTLTRFWTPMLMLAMHNRWKNCECSQNLRIRKHSLSFRLRATLLKLTNEDIGDLEPALFHVRVYTQCIPVSKALSHPLPPYCT